MCLAIPGKVLEINNDGEGIMRTGKVEFGGIKKKINLSMVPEVKVNDYVLVHVGLAISIVDEEEANKTLSFLEGMGELDELKIDENMYR